MPRSSAFAACTVLLSLWLGSPPNAHAEAIVSLTFDDTLAEHAEAAELLEARGLRGTFFVNSPRLGQPGYLSAEALRALQAAGHEIGGHTVHHPRLAGLDAGEVERQICDDRAALLQAGLDVQTLAYPFGAANLGVQAAAAACGYNSARGVGGNGGNGGESVPPENPLYLRTVDSLQCGSDLSATVDRIHQAALQDSTTWFILVVHHLHTVCDAPYTLGWGAFADLLDWLEQRAGPQLRVRTLQQVLGGDTQPAVRGRPAPVRSPHGNLLQNPSLEAAGADPEHAVPDCWQQAGWGDNDYTWLRDPRAVRGSWAQTVTVTRHAFGARRLVSSQDLGACAPRPIPGETYLLTGWYRSDAPVYWRVYYRDAQATWHPWAMGPWFPPTDRFAFRLWRTPPIPPEAEALSVGLSLASEGSLTVDDVALQRWDEAPEALRAACEEGLPGRPPS